MPVIYTILGLLRPSCRHKAKQADHNKATSSEFPWDSTKLEAKIQREDAHSHNGNTDSLLERTGLALKPTFENQLHAS